MRKGDDEGEPRYSLRHCTRDTKLANDPAKLAGDKNLTIRSERAMPRPESFGFINPMEDSPSNPSPATRERHYGMTLGMRAPNGYFDSPEAIASVDEMAELNINWVVIVPTVYHEHRMAPREFRDFALTPSDAELERLIKRFREKGIRVQLRPMLEGYDGTGRTELSFVHDTGRLTKYANDLWQRWFQSFEERCVHYARIARDTGCELYGLDSELDHTVSFNDEWKRVIEATRSMYKGPVTTNFTRRVDFEKWLQDSDHFMHELDMLSISYYYPGSPNEPGGRSSVDEMVSYMRPAAERMERIATLFGKPFFFGECGCRSVANGSATTSQWSPTQPQYDGEEQADYLEAVMSCYESQPWWRGLYWWKWDEHINRPYYKTLDGDLGFTIKGKPAEQTMKRLFQTRT